MGKNLMYVAWPAFMGACLLEGFVFAFVDPQLLQWAGRPLGWSSQSVLTAAFFMFWLIAAAASGLTIVLSSPARDS